MRNAVVDGQDLGVAIEVDRFKRCVTGVKDAA